MKKQIFKLIITILTVLLLLNPGTVFGFEALSAPTPPAAPEAPAAPTPPPAPLAPSAPQPVSEPSPAPVSTNTDSANTSSLPDPTPSPSPTSEQTTVPTSPTTPPDSLSGLSATGQTGTTTIESGSSTTTGIITTQVNDNISINPEITGQETLVNSGNGSESTNNASLDTASNQTTNQSNDVSVSNDLNLQTITGQNNASQNLGDSAIVAGDANTSGTVVTAANTNLDGVMVAEFNVNDNQTGDIVLNFPQNCTLNCATSNTLTTTSNGADSTNNSSISELTNSNTFQNNDGSVSSNLTLNADSGHNLAIQNTGGDSTITTGDANASGNVLTFLNNNLAGNIIIGVVNIFGDLVGNIILPESALAENSGSGTNSTNTTTITQDTISETIQINTSDIQNEVVLSANTGDNIADKNTGGNTVIQTGQADVNSQVLNITNTNTTQDSIWLVLINKAGQWLGQILGATSGDTFAGSPGTQFQVDSNGNITASTSENGANSQNNNQIYQTNNNTINQENTGKVVNHINVSANSGNNYAMQNTGGDSTITTGDANVMLNLVNFVNNNISSGCKLIVTVVNVFGSWLGDFVPPGQTAFSTTPLDNISSNSPTPSSNPSPLSTTQIANSNPAGSTNFGNSSVSTNVSKVVVHSQDNTIENSDQAFVPAPNSSVSRFIQIAGFQTTSENPSVNILGLIKGDQPQSKEPFVFNLAWLILALPLLGGVLLITIKIKTAKRHQNYLA